MTEEKNSYSRPGPSTGGEGEGLDRFEIALMTEQIKAAFDGDPWFGKSVSALLAEADGMFVFDKPAGQHSLLDLLWHMVTWKEFTVSRLKDGDKADTKIFDTLDWRELDHDDTALWQKGIEKIKEVHNELIGLLEKETDELLRQKVAGREYDFRYLLNGIAQHDIYHAGQIAYLSKLLRAKNANS